MKKFPLHSWLFLLGISLFISRPPTLAQTADAGDAVTNSVAVQGMQMFYATYGQGDPMLLLHGFNGSHTVWREFIPELSQRFKIIAPDLRGHGRSTNPSVFEGVELTS